jgi:hypothetical protein
VRQAQGHHSVNEEIIMSKVAIKKNNKIKAGGMGGVNSLAEKAMLVKVTIHSWQIWVTDEKATKEVAERNGAKKDVGQYRKKLIDYSAKKEITEAINDLRSTVAYLTSPWEDGGWRVVSNVGWFDFVKKVDDGRDKILKAVDKFLGGYDEIIAAEKVRQGALFEPERYPTKKEIRAEYGVDVSPAGIPDGNDIRLEVGDAELTKIRMSANDRAQVALDAAVKSIWSRLSEVVGRMADRLKAYKPATDVEKASGTFRDSLVSNIEDLLAVIPSLNITNDTNMVAFANRIQKELAAHSAEVLRDDEKVRTSVQAQADDILKKMSAYL